MDADIVRRRLGDEGGRLTRALAAARDLEAPAAPAASVEAPAQAPSDNATTEVRQQIDRSVADRLAGELAEVEAALRRLDEGDYGICQRCGQPIDEARLEAQPAARLCLDDQTAAERPG